MQDRTPSLFLVRLDWLIGDRLPEKIQDQAVYLLVTLIERRIDEPIRRLTHNVLSATLAISPSAACT